MKLRKWVKVTLAIMLGILLGKVIYDMITIKEVSNGIQCNGSFIKICSSDHYYGL